MGRSIVAVVRVIKACVSNDDCTDMCRTVHFLVDIAGTLCIFGGDETRFSTKHH